MADIVGFGCNEIDAFVVDVAEIIVGAGVEAEAFSLADIVRGADFGQRCDGDRRSGIGVYRGPLWGTFALA